MRDMQVIEGAKAFVQIDGQLYPPDDGKASGMFGYASEMLNLATSRDHPEAFKRFLLAENSRGDKLFSLDSLDLYERNLLQYAIAKGACEIVGWLYDQGLRDGKRSRSQCMSEAMQIKDRRL